MNSKLKKDDQNSSYDRNMQSMSQFYTANYLEESMSYLERTAKKLLPILEEVKKRMIREKRRFNRNSVQ